LQAGNAVSFFGYGLILPFEIIYLHQIRGFATATAGLVLATTRQLADLYDVNMLSTPYFAAKAGMIVRVVNFPPGSARSGPTSTQAVTAAKSYPPSATGSGPSSTAAPASPSCCPTMPPCNARQETEERN
jgi:hypothetical protein